MHHLPAASDAARALGDARIDWVVEEAFAPIVAMHRGVQRVIPLALRRWRRSGWRPSAWEEMRGFVHLLREEEYDAVVDSQSLLKSALVTWITHGPKHGMDAKSAREPLAARFYDARHAVPRHLHAVERNRRLTAQALGFALPAELDYGLRAPASAASSSGAVFLTMTSRADKLWLEAHWIALGRALGIPVLLPWGSDAERERAERIAAALPAAKVPTRMSLEALAQRFSAARCVVGLDTGLTHLAAALGARTAGIYCGSDPALTGIYGAPQAMNVGGAGLPPTPEAVLKALS